MKVYQTDSVHLIRHLTVTPSYTNAKRLCWPEGRSRLCGGLYKIQNEPLDGRIYDKPPLSKVGGPPLGGGGIQQTMKSDQTVRLLNPPVRLLA